MGITFKANFLSYLVRSDMGLRSDMGVSQLREIQRKPVIRKHLSRVSVGR